MLSCRECRRLRLRYQDCDGKDFYRERDIVYCPHQIIWVLKHLVELKTDFWPDKPLTDKEERNYLPSLGGMPTIGKGKYGTASFGRAICVAADVESRIDKTGWDGRALRTFYCQGYTDIVELAIEMGEPVDKVERAIKNALRYVSGWRVKRHRNNTERTYQEFINHRNCELEKVDKIKLDT